MKISEEEENKMAEEKADQEFNEMMKDPEFAADYERISAEGALYQSEPCEPPIEDEEIINDKNHDFSIVVKAKKNQKEIIKLIDLKNPIIGIYKGKEDGKFSSIYSIDTVNGLVKVFGCMDLDAKICQIAIGQNIYIGLQDLIITKNGRDFVKADVRVCK